MIIIIMLFCSKLMMLIYASTTQVSSVKSGPGHSIHDNFCIFQKTCDKNVFCTNAVLKPSQLRNESPCLKNILSLRLGYV